MARPPKSRAGLLAAAEQLFAARGLEGARTEEIAAAAGVNKAMLHYYFESKEKLYEAVLKNLLEQLMASLREPFERAAGPQEALFEAVDRYFTFLQRHPNYPRLLQREMMSERPYLRRAARRYFRPVFRGMARILRAGIRRGDFRAVDVNNTIVSLIGISAFYFAAAPVVNLVLEWDAYDARRAAARKRAVMDFVQHGLLRHPKSRSKRT